MEEIRYIKDWENVIIRNTQSTATNGNIHIDDKFVCWMSVVSKSLTVKVGFTKAKGTYKTAGRSTLCLR